MDRLVQDLRYGLRMLVKRPGFTAASVGTLALGIGAATAIFSVVYGVLLRPLPYERSDQLVRLWEQDAKGHRMNFADPNFEDLRAESRTLSGVAEYGVWPSPVLAGGASTPAVLGVVSRDFFPLMRVEPVRGRAFAAEDQRFGAAPVALVSYGFWQRALGGRSDLASLRLTVERRPTAVVGVLPAGFSFPGDPDVWMPRELLERLPSRSAHNWRVIGRLRDGASLGQARAEAATIGRRLKRQYGADVTSRELAVERMQDAVTGPVQRPLTVLLAAVGLLLLIACVNVANLLSAQAASRGAELAVRSALGAPRGRLVRQFLTEAALLAAAAGTFGVLLARWGIAALLALAPKNLPRLDDVALDLPVLLFSLAVSALIALGLGAFAALRATAGDPQQALTEAGRSNAPSSRAVRLGRALVAGQLAVALVLLVGAGLLGRSLGSVLAVDPGFRTDHVTTLDLLLPEITTPAEKAARVRLLDELLAGLGRLPGVDAVGGAGSLPLASQPADGTFLVLDPGTTTTPTLGQVEQGFRESPRKGEADYLPASAGYFRALGIPLRRGRLFEERDQEDAPHVALVSESLARATWPGQDPLGQVIEFGNMDGDLRPLRVVGVVGDTRSTLERAPRPTIYVDLRQRPQAVHSLVLVMRSSGEPSALVPAARDVVRRLDSSLTPSFGSFTRVVAAAVRSRRFDLTLVGAFALAALLLAAAGLYGIMAYAVAGRRVEVGIRMALGAAPGDVLRLILGEGLRTSIVGVVAGAVGALLLTRAVASLLFEVSPTDPVTFAGVALLLSAVSLVASWLPARQATRVDPAVTLRHD